MDRKYYTEERIFSALAFVAVISAVVYMAALFRIEPVHAAETVVFANVTIEDGSMRPIAQIYNNSDVNATVKPEVKVNAGVKAEVKTENRLQTKATTTATTTTETASEVDTTANIQTSQDLDIYTQSLSQSDRNVEKVEMTDNRILLAYRMPAKFLGFIPVTVMTNVQVDAQGNVSVNYPWYTFLSVKDDEKLKADLELQVKEAIGSDVGTSATTTVAFSELSSRSRAKIIQAIHASLKAEGTVGDVK